MVLCLKFYLNSEKIRLARKCSEAEKLTSKKKTNREEAEID